VPTGGVGNRCTLVTTPQSDLARAATPPSSDIAWGSGWLRSVALRLTSADLVRSEPASCGEPAVAVGDVVGQVTELLYCRCDGVDGPHDIDGERRKVWPAKGKDPNAEWHL
jgi:hypothetical protein